MALLHASMKYTFIIFTLLIASMSSAQYSESLSTANNANDVFYNLNDRTKTELLSSSWDIGFTTAGFDVSIMINENKGVSLYMYSTDTSSWSSVDTNGFNYEANRWFNSNQSWSLGAFCNNGESHPNYGWGTYTSSNHHVYGSKIFILNTNGVYYQVMIQELTVAGEFKFKIADIGGANTQKLSVNKSVYDGKSFFYYDLSGPAVVDAEPMAKDWQLLFTKYHAADQGNYLVSGVKVNSGLLVAERNGVDISSNDTLGLSWTEDITEIGYDWKTFNMGTFSYDIIADRTYFVKNDSGDLWKIYFTDYSGGNYDFTVEKITSNASITGFKALDALAFPNPCKSALNVVNNEGEDCVLSLYDQRGLKVGQFSLLARESKLLNLSEFSAGMYYVQWQSALKSKTQRLIIE